MANYLIKESTLTSMANNIRTMSGTSQTMTANEMASNLRTVNTGIGNEINTQTDLISQIQSALEGKAAGGGGSSGGEIETCTVTVNIYYRGELSEEDFSIQAIIPYYNGNTIDFTYVEEIVNGTVLTVQKGSLNTLNIMLNDGVDGTVKQCDINPDPVDNSVYTIGGYIYIVSGINTISFTPEDGYSNCILDIVFYDTTTSCSSVIESVVF